MLNQEITNIRKTVANYRYLERLIKEKDPQQNLIIERPFLGFSDLRVDHGKLLLQLASENIPPINWIEFLPSLDQNEGLDNEKIKNHVEALQNKVDELEAIKDNLAQFVSLECLQELVTFNFVALEEGTLENLENVFSAWADEIDLKQKEIKNDIKKYKRQLPLQAEFLISENKKIVSSHLPSKYVRIRKLERIDSTGRAFVGVPTGGHLTLEVYDKSKNPARVYHSFVHTKAVLQYDENSLFNKAAKTLHLPENKTYEGLYNSFETDKKGIGPFYKEAFFEVQMDCTYVDEEQFDALYKKVKETIEKQAPNYHFYTNNCTTTAYNLFKDTELAKSLDLPPAKTHTVYDIITPSGAIEYFERANAKIAKQNYQNAKKTTSNFGLTLKFLIVSVIEINPTEILKQKEEFANYEIHLPEIYRVKESLEQYDIKDASIILKLSQAIFMAFEQKLEQQKEEKNLNLYAIEIEFTTYLKAIYDRLVSIDLEEKTEDLTVTKKNKKQLAEFRKLLAEHYLLEEINYPKLITNESKAFFISLDYKLRENRAVSTELKSVYEKTGFANFITNDESISEDSIDKKILNEKDESSANASNEKIDKKWEIDIEVEEEIEIKKVPENSSLENNMDVSNVAKIFAHLDKILLENSHQDNTKCSLLNKITKIKIAIHAIKPMQERSEDKALYDNILLELRKLLGKFNALLYFNIDINLGKTESNLLEYLTKDKKISEIEDYLSHQRDLIKPIDPRILYVNEKPVIGHKQLNVIIEAEQSKRASSFKMPRWIFNTNEYNACAEVKTRYMVKEILSDAKKAPNVKHLEIQKLINSQMPGKWSILQKTKDKRDRYLELVRKAGIHCILEGFTKGSLDEMGLIIAIQQLAKDFPSPTSQKNQPDELLEFIALFKQKYVRILEEQNKLVENQKFNSQTNDEVLPKQGVKNITVSIEGTEHSIAKHHLMDPNKKYINSLKKFFGNGTIKQIKALEGVDKSDNIEEHVDFAIMRRRFPIDASYSIKGLRR